MLEAVSDDHLFVVPAMAGQMQKRVCEGKTMSIKCAKGVINVVKASYGRQHGKEVCPSTAIKTQDCHAVSSLKKVKQFCEGKSSCSVQSTNTHFGDPCGGTHKYLTVQYVCKAGKPAGKCLCGNTSVFCTTDCSFVQVPIHVRKTTAAVTVHASARTRRVNSSVAIARKGGTMTAPRVAKKPLQVCA